MKKYIALVILMFLFTCSITLGLRLKCHFGDIKPTDCSDGKKTVLCIRG